MVNPVLYADQCQDTDITLLRNPTGSIVGIAVQFGRVYRVPTVQFVTRLLTHMVPQITTGLETPDILTLQTWINGFSNTAKASGIFKVTLVLPKSGVHVHLYGQAHRRSTISHD